MHLSLQKEQQCTSSAPRITLHLRGSFIFQCHSLQVWYFFCATTAELSHLVCKAQVWKMALLWALTVVTELQFQWNICFCYTKLGLQSLLPFSFVFLSPSLHGPVFWQPCRASQGPALPSLHWAQTFSQACCPSPLHLYPASLLTVWFWHQLWL